jgi:hypothetical protein
MDSKNIIRIDGIKWWITQSKAGVRLPVPLCPEHDLRMTSVSPKVYNSVSRRYFDGSYTDGTSLKCAEGPHITELSRKYNEELQYVIDRIDAKVFKGMKVLNLDDETIPIAKAKATSKDDKYFITAQLM